MTHKNRRHNLRQHPSNIFLIVVLVILISESVGMLILGMLNHEISYLEEAAEVVTLTILLSTLVYYMLIQPLSLEIQRRRAAEAELREQHDRLEQVTAAIGAGLAVISKDYHLIWCNRIMQQNFDCNPGAQCHQTFKQHERPCDDCGVRELFENNSSMSSGEHLLTDKQGNRTWYDVIVTPIRDEQGAIHSALELLVPIETRKTIEENLVASKERFRNLVENSTDWVWEVDAEGRYTYAGPQCRQLLGYEPEELLGITPFKIMEPSEGERVTAVFKGIIERREQFTLLENTVLRKDGGMVVMETSGSPFFNRSGQFMGYRGIDRDISARKQLEQLMHIYQQELELQVKEQTIHLQNILKEKEQLLMEELQVEVALRASEARFRQIFENNDDGIILFDRQTTHALDINPAALAVFCIGARANEPLSWADFGICDKTGHKIEFDLIATNDRFTLTRATSLLQNGSTLTLNAWGKLLVIDNREVVYFSLHDISEKVQIEQESRLIQTKLIQANKMMSLGLLISGIAHEINNPNNSILLGSQLMSRAWNDVYPLLDSRFRNEGDYILGGSSYSEMRESIPRLLAMVTESSRRIEGIIHNLREFVIQGSSDNSQQIDINRIVSVSVSILQNHIKKHTEKFTISLQDDLPPACGNPQQLEQVIVNLIMNAIQALPSRERGVRVSTGYRQDSKQIVITVQDEGCGIPPELQPHIFEPFVSTKLESGGTGLGLAISSLIVKEHHGQLEVASTLNEGTTCAVILPTVGSVKEEYSS
jgi:PAS domain S-box-containing protein